MKEAGALLARGESVIVFPKARAARATPWASSKAQRAFKMAFAAGAPVVPVVIDRSYKIMEANHNLMCPGHVTMTVLPPIETAAGPGGAESAAGRGGPAHCRAQRIKPQRTDAAQRRIIKVAGRPAADT